MKLKILTQRYGNGLAIGMSGDKAEIERQSNIFYNYKVTNSDPIWMCDRFAYILTTEAALFAGMVTKATVSLIDSKFAVRTVRGGKRVCMVAQLAKEKAKRQIEAFVSETFLNDTEARECTDAAS
jgi:hypothetical protein